MSGARIYLAARYSRRLELCGYKQEIEGLKMGYTVRARWLDGEHQISDDGMPLGEGGERLVEGDCQGARASELRMRFAAEDLLDVAMADLVINFTEPPRSSASRGGRHVEFGIALAQQKRVFVVGYRENIFHWVPRVEFFNTWEFCLAQLRTEGAA